MSRVAAGDCSQKISRVSDGADRLTNIATIGVDRDDYVMNLVGAGCCCFAIICEIGKIQAGDIVG